MLTEIYIEALNIDEELADQAHAEFAMRYNQSVVTRSLRPIITS